MKKKMMNLVCGILGTAMVLSLASCGAGKQFDSSQMANVAIPEGFYGDQEYLDEMQESTQTDYETGVGSSASPVQDYSKGSAAATQQKLIKTVNLDVETKEYDELMKAIEEQVSSLNGYIENMESYNGSQYSSYRNSRNASLTIRIPKASLNVFLDAVSENSNVVRRTENVKDITLNYVDLQSHKEALMVEQERLLELLTRAEELESIIMLEDRLSNVRYQIESMEKQLRSFDNQVDYSTVYLKISEVKELTPVEEKTTLQEITDGFLDSCKSIGRGLKNFLIWIIVVLPYLVLWGAIITGIVFFVKWRIRAAKNKKIKKQGIMQNRQNAQESVGTNDRTL